MRRKLLELAAVALMAAGNLVLAEGSLAAESPVKIRLSVDEDPIQVRLAERLGYFAEEGIEIVSTPVESVAKDDYLMQEPLTKGQLDASYHWFNHTVFGARHGFPIKAVMIFNDAPAMTVMIANRIKGKVHGAADFKGLNIAQGAGYGTKAAITSYLVQKAGLAPTSYKPVMLEHEGRQEAVLKGLREGTVDVMTFQEPTTSALAATHLISVLYDFNSKESTAKVLGAPFPAQSLLMSPDYIATHPETVQHLVNAFVKAARFINHHSVDEIVGALPPSYFTGKDRGATVKYLKDTLPSYANGDYSVSPEAAQLVVKVMQSSQFDSSEEGEWRAGGDNAKIHPAELYDNTYVLNAMKAIR